MHGTKTSKVYEYFVYRKMKRLKNTQRKKIKKDLEHANQIDVKKSDKYLSKELKYFQDKTQILKGSYGRRKGNLKI